MRCKVGLLGNAALASPATLHSGTLYHAPVSRIELVQQSRHRRNEIVDQDSAIRQEQQFCMVLNHSCFAPDIPLDRREYRRMFRHVNKTMRPFTPLASTRNPPTRCRPRSEASNTSTNAPGRPRSLGGGVPGKEMFRKGPPSF